MGTKFLFAFLIVISKIDSPKSYLIPMSHLLLFTSVPLIVFPISVSTLNNRQCNLNYKLFYQLCLMNKVINTRRE